MNSQKYYEKHEENRARLSKYYSDNHEKEKAARREHYQKNKSTYLFNYYKREDRLKEATPNWLTTEMLSEIKEIYARRQEVSNVTGIEHHVDHVVPIQGIDVCGLHVPWNLQILTAEENLRKSNKYE
jgi:5-methylcytosine-specific restriction endonuclease McrA